MKKFKIQPEILADLFWDYHAWNEPALTTKKAIREFLCGGVLWFAYEDGKLDKIAQENGFSDYIIGNIKKTVDLIHQQTLRDINLGLLWTE